jgi:hypothetical protein
LLEIITDLGWVIDITGPVMDRAEHNAKIAQHGPVVSEGTNLHDRLTGGKGAHVRSNVSAQRAVEPSAAAKR